MGTSPQTSKLAGEKGANSGGKQKRRVGGTTQTKVRQN